MAEVNEQEVERKINAGESLTEEETKHVMSYPNEGGDSVATAEKDADDDIEEKDYEDIDENAESGDKEGEEAAEAKKKADEEAAEKAKTVAAKKAEEEKKAEEKKKAEEDAGEEGDKTENLKDKIEKEMDKPEGQEDLEGFSEREKGLFWEMRAERKKRQAAQEETDGLKFQRIKEKKAAEEAAKAAEADGEGKAELEKLLEGEDDDFVSKADLKKVLESISKKPAKKADDTAEAAAAYSARKEFVTISERGARDIVEQRRIKGDNAPDYDKVMELAEDIVEGNKEYLEQVEAAYKAGKNPALITYDLVIKDRRFSTLYKGTDVKKEEKKETTLAERAKKVGLSETATEEEIIKKEGALKKNDKINKNKEKPDTSGSHGGGSGTAYKDSEGKEYDIVSLSQMSTSDFRKVPKDVRDKFLKNF